MTLQFPAGFLFGASTAAHQVEGNNTNSDFWLMEHLEVTSFKEPSGDAVDHYRLYREDIAMLAGFGLNAYRFSIEWARIEPEEGKFDEEAIEHYRDVLRTCKAFRITPIVTLHHFSSPAWLIREGGWESEKTPERFARYCGYVIRELGEMIPYACTINEANGAIGIAKIIKQFQSASSTAQVGINIDFANRMKEYYMVLGNAFGISPQDVHPFLAPRTERGLQIIFQAHEEARRTMKQIRPEILIGITLSLFDFQSVSGGEEHAEHALQEEFQQFLPYLKDDDFFGLQNYTREIYGPDGQLPVPEDAEKTQMGYEYYPQGLESVIRYVSKNLDMPIFVTENGVGTDNDERRVAFIDQALKGVHACVSDGIPVKGYMHWSLLDNFEWQLGYSKTFGLVAVDRSTQKRIPKPSAYHLGSIAQRGALQS
ncbi:glycoside hydrolase family 1 [Paenibacillus sp. FSL P4-0081]|uniref:glycoside hydrolase family 1 protein n=1 Tax=unclassified Paenibacillus TaxID=185978 RepID=UPI0004F60AC6|nr:family 1 glycosylhydrolase [Paenibacillus sp. FSL P4-0081]AIQ31520.1 glycoside hydrolase family 1 [Paenibacillus sp. FSL P4-0081]